MPLSNEKIYLLALLGLFATGCDAGYPPRGAPVVNKSTSQVDNGGCVAVVRAYVSKTKGWGAADYRVVAEQVSGGVKGFSVLHRDDVESLLPEGGRKSFHVDVDQQCERVIRELGYQ